MGKFYGKVGFIVHTETTRGVFIEKPVERAYRGDITHIYNRWSVNPDQINNDLSISNRISIVMDPFAYEHFSAIRYVEFGGTKWQVNSVEVSYPRLILSIGGEYNNVPKPTANSGSLGSAFG